jgi:Zn-dependent M28 family amino/carboxypeptidase
LIGDNVCAEIAGSARASEVVLVGAHYDTVAGCPGANDNGTGVAALLALARRFASVHAERTLRFVAFPGEEPPAFQTEAMGSLVFARASRAKGEKITAMICLETLGCYSDESGSQTYPIPMLRIAYPDRGDFVAFVGNVASRGLVREAIETFREKAAFPSEGAALPARIPGVGWSDQWSFWEQGYPAIMVTDTAPFRYPHYHRASDTAEKVDFERLARVVEGLCSTVARLAAAGNVGS